MRYLSVTLISPFETRVFTLQDDSLKVMSIGNKKGSDMPLQGDWGDEVFELALYRSGENWFVSIGEGLKCLKEDGNGGSDRTQLKHNLTLQFEGQKNGGKVLTLGVMEHFDFSGVAFDRRVDLGAARSVTVGGTPRCGIRLSTASSGREEVVLTRQGPGFLLEKTAGDYPVYLNRQLVKGQVTLSEGDFFSVADVQFYYRENSLFVDKAIKLSTNGLSSMVLLQQTSALDYPVFIRSTRVQHQVKTDEIDVAQPRSPNQREPDNVLLRVLPPAVLIIAMLLMRGSMGGGMGFMAFMVVSMGVSVLVTILTMRESKKRNIIAEQKRKDAYYAYIQKKVEEIKLRRQDELRILDRIYRSVDDNLAIVKNFEKGLFDRSPQDVDFLDVRLGRGTREASIKVKTNIPEYRESDDELQDVALDVVEKYRYLNDAPVVARLRKSHGIGVAGKRQWLYEMLKYMTVDLTVRHYYKELRLYFVISEEDRRDFAWTRWLRNCFDEETGTYRNILCDDESNKFHLEVLYRLLSERESSVGDGDVLWPEHVVVFVYRVDLIRNHPISQYFERSANLGVHFIFFDENEERIPRGCSQLIRLDRMTSSGDLIYTADGERPYHFEYATIMQERMREVVMKLCKVRVVEANLANEMVKSITLYELLNIKRAQEIDLITQWSRSRIDKSMAVPLGVRVKNAVVSLDLHEKAHGPHGLVAGTTGSGKSEIMQSYIINMALYFHPYEVTFLLIDFKGGGMANQFLGLPHLAGAITDIDGREIDRSLKSIKAELERRKHLFAQANVNKIDDYIKMYKKDSASVPSPLPHLIIVVDEFAELKAEQPDFMKELVSAARIGRSLGVHLILATQKPSGVVDGQIWSNSRFKLCLKVQTKEDSQEMLKTPLAAEIREPGRAYLQVGNNEIFELFQSAYSGAPVPNVDPNAVKPYKVHELNMWGKQQVVYQVEAPRAEDGTVRKPPTQLDALVDYVGDYCKQRNIAPLPSIVLPPLLETLPLSDLEGAKKDLLEGILVSAARYDDPEQQYQGDYVMNLSTDNIFMIGAAQMGKTTALLSIIYQAIMNYSPKEIQFYMIDAGNMALKVFEGMPHVGGVVVLAEEDRVKNLFKMISIMISDRKSQLMASGVGTHRAYLEAGKRDMPQVMLVIDNVAAFREYYEQYDDALQMLAREGISVGITMMVTGIASNNLTYRTGSNFGERLCFTVNDVSEYGSMMNIRGIEPAPFPGRALVVLDKRVLEAQFAISHEGETELQRRELMQQDLLERAKDFDFVAPPIPLVPDRLYLEDAKRQVPDLMKEPYRMVVGISYDTVEFLSLRLDSVVSLIINGRPRSGKHTAVRSILHQIQLNPFVHRSDVYVFDDARRTLSDVKDLGTVKRYTTDVEEMRQSVEEVWEELEERQNKLYETDDESLRDQLRATWPLKLFVINGERATKAISGNSAAQEKMTDILSRFNDCKVCAIWCEYPNAKPSIISATDLDRTIHAQNAFMFFDHLQNLKMIDLSLQTLREMNRPYVLGDAFVYSNDQLSHIKTVDAGEKPAK